MNFPWSYFPWTCSAKLPGSDVWTQWAAWGKYRGGNWLLLESVEVGGAGQIFLLDCRARGSEKEVRQVEELRFSPRRLLSSQNLLFSALVLLPASCGCQSSQKPAGAQIIIASSKAPCNLSNNIWKSWSEASVTERMVQGHIYYMLNSFFFLSFSCFLVRNIHGSSQAGHQIGAEAAGLHCSHSNHGSKPHL